MMAENVAGIIITPTAGVEAAYKQLAQTNIAVVSVDRRMAHIDVDTVITEQKLYANPKFTYGNLLWLDKINMQMIPR